MNFKQKILRLAVKGIKTGIKILWRDKTSLISSIIIDEMTPIIRKKTNLGLIRFICTNQLLEYRAKSLLTKEPETIKWIGSLKRSEVFWDIGANVGVYSLYAGLKKMTVLSFEPSPSNYYILNKNIEINKMSDTIFSLCLAFNNTTKLDSFYMSNTELGGALNSFSEPIDWKGNPLEFSFKQGMIGYSIDDFIKQFNPSFPNHIKIDVDGIEDKIIMGAKKTIEDNRVKSILVELDSSRKKYCDGVIQIIENAGLKFKYKKHELRNEKNGSAFSDNYFFFRS